MNLIRKPVWLSLVLGAVFGCADVEDATPQPLPTTTPPRAERLNPPPATKSEPAKGGMSAELAPAPSSTSEKPGESKKDEPPKVEGPKTEGSQSDAAPVKLSGDELAEIKKLPADEQDLAIKQAVCPVSGEHLGEMGKPVKVNAEGRTFFLCCENCEKDVKADPKAVIAKLDKKGQEH
jgi:hypothetical protein